MFSYQANFSDLAFFRIVEKDWSALGLELAIAIACGRKTRKFFISRQALSALTCSVLPRNFGRIWPEVL